MLLDGRQHRNNPLQRCKAQGPILLSGRLNRHCHGTVLVFPTHICRGRTRQSKVQAAALPRLPRNWQAFKMDVKYSLVNLQDQFWSLPFLAQTVQKLQALQRPMTAAIMTAVTAASRWLQDRSHEYDDFSTAENMREWKWRRKNEQEWDLWSRIVYAAVGVFFTVVWEAIVPTSLFWALVPPLWAAWTLYDNWLVSPFVLGLIIMLPLKFPPYSSWRWI